MKEALIRISLVLGSIALTLLLTEVGMAIAGLPKGLDFSNRHFYDDRDYQYGIRPGLRKMFGTDVRINSRGLRGPEFDRVDYLALGDSCTFMRTVKEEEAYPFLLASPTVSAVNAGTPGYDSLQGLWWLKRSQLLDLHPKLVTLYYGWNDHWRAAAPQKVFRWLRYLAPHSRIGTQLLRFEASIWDDVPPMSRYRWFPLVSVADFESNLKEMIRLARDAGAVVVLITAPSEPRLVTPGEGAFKRPGAIAELDDHPRYVEAVRRVAKETGAGLVDFAAEMERRKTDAPLDYFMDFVHPNARGQQVLAELLRPWLDCAMRRACPPR